MKYWELVRVGAKTSASTPVPPESCVDDTAKGTNLNKEEARYVLKKLEEYRDKYYKDIPLKIPADPKFIFNIPKSIYKASTYVRDTSKPDSMDPLYWFYLFCTEEPQDMIGKFLITAINIIPNEEYSYIEESANEYDQLYLEDESDPDDGTTDTIEVPEEDEHVDVIVVDDVVIENE